MRTISRGGIPCAFALICALLMDASAAQTFERGVVRITQDGREARLSVEIARNAKARAQGLMGRERLAENAGMLFVYKGDAQRFFWMKNTLIPLSLAFIDKSGEVLEIIHLQPHRPGKRIPSYRSRNKVRRVLEVNQGWFLRNGFGLGARVFLE
ncbi:MAG: DUF192 domain-containing protein [Nitrospinae bacterium]|nr:DUF192 domain-containing protein [Nitrospinota bacterium]